MAKNQERMNRAQDRALENLDYVMDCYETQSRKVWIFAMFITEEI